ncbi:MAG: LPXTG cell wall anchor domain-containing protein, partial [Firmicutes bacterium]|nr:LPXTG cell wall anchor domain-containing protein [Bacillota bacterium]
TGTASMYQLKTIAAGKTESIDIKVRALDEISGQVQYIDAEVKFQYFNRVTTADGSGSGRVTIPAEVKKAKEPEPEVVIDSPVPNLIVESFSYGNSSVAAGSEFNLGFRFINTSRTLDVENVVVTVDGGTSFTLNGAANTVYFNKIEAKGQKTVNVPMKALQTLTNGAEPVMINFKYEYVDKQKRIPASADVKITVPVYQPDRFEITAPTAPVVVYAGEELALTMNYVNKGKSPVNNLEAKVEGISSITPVQNLGNIEAGRSGTMAFAVTPQEAGEAEFSFIISYEDANGESKERIFPVVVNVEEMVFEDTGMEEPMFEPEPEKNVPWTLIGGISAVIAAAAAFLILKKRKKAKAAKAAQMWDSWDDEEEAEQPAATEGNKEGK